MAKNVLKTEKNLEASPDFDKKTDSKTSSTFDIKPKSMIQFVGTEKKMTPFEIKMVENYLMKAVFSRYKMDGKKFQIFIEGLMKTLKDLAAKPEKEVPKPIDLEIMIEEYIYKSLHFLKKELIAELIKRNGLLSFLIIITQDKLSKDNLRDSFIGKRIRHNQKIIYCSNERYGCIYKGKFSDFLLHEKDDCQFEKICCAFMNCKAKEFRKDMKAHEKVCPFKDNPRTENKDLSILLHIDESRMNFGDNKKKEDDQNSSVESQDSPIFSWLMLLFNRIKVKFKLNQVQVQDLHVNKKNAKFSSLKTSSSVIKFIYSLLIMIFFDSAVSIFFFLSLLLKIGTEAPHIQGAYLAYLISISFILMLDILVSFLSILLSFFLFYKNLEGFGVCLRALISFGVCRVVTSIVLFANFTIFEQSNVCKDIADLCSLNDAAQIDHYASFSIQISATFLLLLIDCKY